MNDLKNLHILVTGAGSGIGRQIAKDLAKEGAQVTALDRNEETLNQLKAQTANIETITCDVTSVPNIEKVLERAERARGPLYGVVHAAGILISGSLLDDAMTSERFREAVRVNLEGTWNIARAVALRMLPQKNGSIVLISSNAGSTPRIGMGAYCASKAGATMVMRCLALELGRSGVRCNSVSPGSTDTPMLGNMLTTGNFDTVIAGDLDTYRTGIPMGRIATPADISHATRFLLSQHSSQITGHDLRVDGGATWS